MNSNNSEGGFGITLYTERSHGKHIDLTAECADCGARPGERCAPSCHQVTDSEPKPSARGKKLEAHKNLAGMRLISKLEHPADYMPNTDGYMAGIADFRHHRTPEHSQSAYRFPHSGTVEDQETYNTQYYEAQRDMERARELNVAWFELHKEEL